VNKQGFGGKKRESRVKWSFIPWGCKEEEEGRIKRHWTIGGDVERGYTGEKSKRGNRVCRSVLAWWTADVTWVEAQVRSHGGCEDKIAKENPHAARRRRCRYGRLETDGSRGREYIGKR